MMKTVSLPEKVSQLISHTAQRLLSHKSMRRLIAGVLLCAAVLVPPCLAAEPKSVGSAICDGYDGLPFAFCVAICEARECHRQPAYDKRCATLRSGFGRVTGGQSAPCETGAATDGTLEPL